MFFRKTKLSLVLLAAILVSLNIFAQQEADRPKIGVVLSGGGAKGFAHIGALKVLVEAGVPIDYVGGTSMGGIMGGLFAVGYHPDTLQKIVFAQDWNDLLAGNLSRRDLSMAEKEEDGKYFFTLPFRDKKLKLPTGVVAGQSVYDLFSYYTSPGFHIQDFHDLQIPFLCIAADIETGENVVLDKGYLPDALRATMAIPTVFAPIEIDGRLLVDGGLVNNYPVAEVRKMGADIIIGVDVSDPLKSKEDLNSLIKILDQTTSFLRRPLHNIGIQNTDILIRPGLEGYGVSSFNDADSLIAKGERAARQKLPEILALLDSINNIHPVEVGYKLDAQPIDSILINVVIIEGINKVSPNFVRSLLQLEVTRYHSMKKIFNALARLYGTQNFDMIRYRFELLESGGYRFVINLKEKVGGEFRVGVNYDTDFKASFLLNMTFRNIMLSNSRLLFDLTLGDNNAFRANYLYDRGWKPGFGVQFEVDNFTAYVYDEKAKIGSFDFSNALFDVYTHSNIGDFTVLGGGLQLEFSSLRPDIFLFDIESINEYNTNLVAFLNVDNLDQLVYPKSGIRLATQFKFVMDVEDSLSNPSDPLAVVFANYTAAIPLNKKFTLVPRAFFGSMLTRGDFVLPQYAFYMGGLRQSNLNAIFPFVGLEFMQVSDYNGLVGRLDLQYEFFKDFYLVPKWNIGFRSEDLQNIFSDSRPINGYGLTLGVKTMLGPIEISVMSSDYDNKVLGYFNLGYNF
jgi:NTE family protein